MDRKILVAGVGIVGFLFVFYLIVFTQTGAEGESQAGKASVKDEIFSAWKPFTSEKNHFSALFPLLPQKVSHAVTTPGSAQKATLTMYVSESPNGTVLSVRVVKYSEEEKDVMDLMKLTMNSMMEAHSESVLRDIRENTFLGNPGLEFSIQDPEIRIMAQSFFKDNAQYSLIYISKLDSFDEDIFRHFVSSFKLTNGG